MSSSSRKFIDKGVDFTQQSRIHETLRTIATNTANTTIKADTLNLNTDGLEALQGVTNTKLIEISGKNTDIDNSVKANTITVAKLNQILTKNTEIDTVLDSCSAKLTDVDDSVKANAVTVAKLNQILTKNTEIDTVLDSCSAKLSDIDTTAAATATILRPYLIEGNATTVLIKNANHSDLVNIKSAVEAATPTGTNRIGRIGITANESHNGSGTERHLVCDDNGRLQVDVRDATGSLTVSGTVTANLSSTDNAVLDSSLTKQGEIETSLNSLIAANHTDLVALEASLASMEGKMDTDNAVYDNQLTKLTEIDTAIDTIDGVLDSSLTKQGEIETSLNSLIAANHTDLVTLEASLTSMEGKMDTDNVVYDNQLTKLTEIDTAIDTIDGVLDSSLTKQGEIESSLNSLISANHTDLVTLEASLTSMEGKMDTDNAVYDNQLTKLTEIDTAIDTIDSVLDASLVKQTAMTTDIAAIESLLTAANVDHAANEALLITIDADTNAIKTSVQLIDDVVKTEDLAHSTGDKGIMSLCVRQDSQADFGGNGDYVPMSINADGELRTTGSSVSTVMSVDTLMNNVSIASSATTNSSVFTKPKNVSNFSVLISSASGSGGFALRESKSVDGTTYIENNTNLNAASDRQLHITETLAQFKFYRYAITNVEVGSVNHTIKISY